MCSTSGDVEGAARAAGEDDQTVAPSFNVVKHVCVVALDSCQKTDRDSRGQGRQPRAARADRNRDRATAEDRDMDLRAFKAASMHESDDDVFG